MRREASRKDDSARTRRLLRLVDPGSGEEPPRSAPHRPLVLFRGESWRLFPDGSLRRWDAADQCWKSIWRGRWSRDEATFVEGDPAPSVPAASAGSHPPVEGCTFLGGTLESPCVYGKYTIAFEKSGIKLHSYEAGTIEIPFDDVVSIHVGGRGRVPRGGGRRESIVLDGDGEMAAAPVVKSLVARTRVDTSIRIETINGEGIFHCDCATPDELRNSLASFMTDLPRQSTSSPSPSPRRDVATRLLELADLMFGGFLTEDEFNAAKAAVLSDLR